MNRGCLKSLSDQVKGEVRNAKRTQDDRLKAQREVEVKLKKLREGASIKETDEALSRHVKNISEQVRSSLQRDEVRSAFCTWEEKDLPQIDDNIRRNVERLKKIYIQCIEQRLEKFLQALEKGDQLFLKAHADLEQRFRQGFFEFEKDVRHVDRFLVGESSDEELLQFEEGPGKLSSFLFFFLTSVVFLPVLFSIGLVAGVLSAPVIGYLVVDRILNERHVRTHCCQVLRELSTQFLQQKNIEKEIFDRVSQEFSKERERISRMKRCYQELLEMYEKKCNDLTKCEDDEKIKEDVKRLTPLYEKLDAMNQNLTFDAIKHGICVTSFSFEIDKNSLHYKETSRYKVGEGSYGEVYKGKLSLPGHEGRKVAVKKLKGTPTASNVASFIEEVDVLM